MLDEWVDFPASPGQPQDIEVPDCAPRESLHVPWRENLWVIYIEDDGYVSIYGWPVPAEAPC